MLMVNDYEGQDNVLEEKEKRWVYLTLTSPKQNMITITCSDYAFFP